jgi:ribosomal protein S18 acetylase RimI-like enzyme
MEVLPANQFTFEQATAAYNLGRVDYLVPMPMSVERLREYAAKYDVDINHSFISINDEREISGLLMLGVREKRTWITRLGVGANGRRQGTGQGLIQAAIDRSYALKADNIWLEVIKNNDPAHRLFIRNGFTQTRELIVARRAPTPMDVMVDDTTAVSLLNRSQMIDLLPHRRLRPNWLNETESLLNIAGLSGLMVNLADGSSGWVVYHVGQYKLENIVVEVLEGDLAKVTTAVLSALHNHHPMRDSVAANLLEDEQWEGFKKAGYFDAFRRIEMVKSLV